MRLIPPTKTIPIRQYFLIRNTLLLWVFILGISSVAAQTIPEKLKTSMDSLIKAAPKTYLELDGLLKNYRGDTIAMGYFSDLSEQKKYTAGLAYSLNMIGTKYRDISEYNKAIAFHKRALGVAITSNNLEFRIYSLNMLGVDYRRSDAIKTALDYNQEALELAEAIENPSEEIKRSINVSLNGIGNIYSILEQYDLAIVQFEKSMEMELELGNTLGLAINNQNIGEALEEQGKLDEALKHYRTSLEHNNTINSEKGKVICQNSVAQVYIKQNRALEAIKQLEPAYKTAQKIGDQYTTSIILINLGWANMKLNRLTKAAEYLQKGVALSQKHNMPRVGALGYKLLSDLSQLRGDYKSALSYYKKNKDFDENYINERNIRVVNDMIIKYDTEKKTNQINDLTKKNQLSELQLRKNQTTLLISGIALALLAGILYILYHQNQLKSEKKLLTLEQTMLRSQMNPHFLFNSLNSIKLYIINNEQKNAVHYLNKFSKLIRKILEASSLKEISLAEELETVELYMNIENIRFSNEIIFKIDIDDNIDIHTIKIPSLILQPFLENALWHGLSSKKGQKTILLNVSKEDGNFIQISIVDDGVGRAEAERIKQGKVLKRKSIGIDITKERLANFSKDYQNSFDVEFVDLYDKNDKACGTKVILHIPTL